MTPQRDGARMAARKRKTTRSAAPRRYYGPKRKSRRTKSGIAQIPAAGATVGVAIANKDAIMNVVNNPSIESVKTSAKYALQPEQLRKDVVYGAVGLGVGAGIKKFAPRFLKTPLGKIAKKIPKFF